MSCSFQSLSGPVRLAFGSPLARPRRPSSFSSWENQSCSAWWAGRLECCSEWLDLTWLARRCVGPWKCRLSPWRSLLSSRLLLACFLGITRRGRHLCWIPSKHCATNETAGSKVSGQRMRTKSRWYIVTSLVVLAGLFVGFGLSHSAQPQHFTAQIE